MAGINVGAAAGPAGRRPVYYGSHRVASDPKLDLAVVHTSNTTPFGELAAVLDALHAPARDLVVGPGQQVRAPAFEVAFAID